MFLEKLQNLAESEQIFLALEAKVDAPTLKKIEKYAKQVQKFDLPALPFGREQAGKFNIFSITDGLVAKDRGRLRISYIDLLQKGAVAEEIHGILFWQVKNMLLASRTDSQTDSGLAPFSYKNALTGARKYKTEELLTMSSELVNMTHRVRSGDGELEIMVEKWILQI